MEYTEEILKIAKFMGINPIKGFSEHTGSEYYYYNNSEMKDYEALPFYRSWDELMPVLEKICRLKIGDGVLTIDYANPRTFGMINEETGGIMVRLNGCQVFEAETLIEATFLAIVDFLNFLDESNI